MQCRRARRWARKRTRHPILPRQGEVAAKLTEGEEARRRVSRVPPLRRLRRHLPLAGEDCWTSTHVFRHPELVPGVHRAAADAQAVRASSVVAWWTPAQGWGDKQGRRRRAPFQCRTSSDLFWTMQPPFSDPACRLVTPRSRGVSDASSPRIRRAAGKNPQFSIGRRTKPRFQSSESTALTPRNGAHAQSASPIAPHQLIPAAK